MPELLIFTIRMGIHQPPAARQAHRPDGGSYVGIIFNSTDTWEYVGQNLAKPIPTGSKILSNFYTGGGTLSRYYVDGGDRRVCLYGIPNVVAMPVIGKNHIETMGLGAVKLGEFQLTSTGLDWEIASVEFTAPFDIKCLVFGGETSETNRRYLCIDRLLVSEKSNFVCP